MRVFLLTVLFLIGMSACGSIVKETGKGIVSSVVEDFDEYDLSDAADEALAVGKQNGTSAFTYVGLALFAGGAIAWAFLSMNAGVKLMVAGGVAGSVPYIVQSEYFSIVISGALLLTLLIAIYHLWWKVRKIENGEDTKP